jgi:glycosyltransferase involved in cell wall biosynthesis
VSDPSGDIPSNRRVARVITRLNIGGPAIQAIALSHELEAFGFPTLLIHGRLAAGEGDMTALLPTDQLNSRYLPTLVRPLSPLRDLITLWRLYHLFRKWRPALVHTHMAKAGSLGRLAALLYNVSGINPPARLVHTYHGHVFDRYFGSLMSRVFVAVERWLGRRTSAVIAVSPQIRDEVVSTFRVAPPERTHVIRLGFDLRRFFAIDAVARSRAREALAVPADAVVVITVGRLTAIKQQSLFVQMAARLAADHQHVRFLIVGDGELRPALEQQAAAVKIADRLRFLGWRRDLELIYGAADIFVLTSRNEGTPVALIEAMASGVASVSTDVGGVRDVIADPSAGILLASGDEDALVSAVHRLIQSPALRRTIGDAGRDGVKERFDLGRLTADISDLYTRLLQQR